jgi:tRNA threonylcarbamoyladenosine biosynthesis protein TsaE
MTTSAETRSVEETRDFGRRLGAALEAGDVIALEGELGSGKTELVKGIAEALGITSVVHSPTFVLHHRYAGRLPLEHFDLYRLDGVAWVDTGIDEASPDAVTVIEWPNRAAVLDDWATAQIRLRADGETARRLTLLRGPDRIRAVFEHANRD